MEDVTSWFDKVSAASAEMINAVAGYMPSLLGTILLLIAGWVIARIARAATLRLGDGVNRLLDRFMRVGSLARFRLSPRVVRLISDAAFWLIILFFITAATRVARLDVFSSWLDRIVAYLPTLFAGGLIILAGFLVSVMVRDLVSATLASARFAQSELFGTLAQGATFLTAAIIGVDQIGIDVTFLVTIVTLVIGAILASLALAFGLGARTFVSNLIGAHYLQQQFQPGQTARIGEIEGEILDLTPTSVTLATAQGRMSVPAKVFNEDITILVTPAQDDE